MTGDRLLYYLLKWFIKRNKSNQYGLQSCKVFVQGYGRRLFRRDRVKYRSRIFGFRHST